ncbi:hypothetical protein [Pseudofrankia sp. BMG5.37]|uniref:hypothetical protein n=1 Tax=Pseudofrankia sp. BMG5.37 TaxID=3050035 RepID=UPI002898761A|nr:hypothetical protein [Pseudofrankia sp. BMG5.37]
MMTSTSPATFPYGDVTAVPAAGKAASASQDTSAAGTETDGDAEDRAAAGAVSRVA